MAKDKKQDDPKKKENTVNTPRPPQHMDPSSPPGKGRNADDHKRGEITKEKKQQ